VQKVLITCSFCPFKVVEGQGLINTSQPLPRQVFASFHVLQASIKHTPPMRPVTHCWRASRRLWPGSAVLRLAPLAAGYACS
jgi:hypothetical protein